MNRYQVINMKDRANPESKGRRIMTKRTPIIPFPRRNDRDNSMIRLQRQATAGDSMREKPPEIGNSSSVESSVADKELLQLPDHYGLVNEQCDVLVDAMQALVKYVEDGGEETAGRLRAIWSRGDALKECHVDMLERTSTTAFNFKSIFRAVVTLDLAIDCAKTTTGYILDLGPPADSFMFEMAAENKIGARALHGGFSKLATHPFQAAEDLHAVYRAKRNIEKIYRDALGELVDDDKTLKMRKADRTSSKAMSNTFGIFERREIYHYLSKSAKRYVWAANRLREIVSHSQSH